MVQPIDPSQHILDLFEERNANKANDTGYADSITAMIATVFDSNCKFIYELIQNAEDSKAKRVRFELANGHLLVSHDGDHFAKEDVERICANASLTKHEKNTNISKIGYKGVGFKAVFCISEKVTILSKRYCFCFDKSRFANTETARYPWQIIPLLSNKEQVETAVGRNIDDKDGEELVHFLLENVRQEAIEKEITEIFSSLEVLLALRSVESISLIHKKVEILRSEPMRGGYVVLKKKEKKKVVEEKQWYLSNTEIDLTCEVALKEKIRELNPSACPEKIKQAESINMVFAAQRDPDTGGVRACTDDVEANLYCYLPTSIHTGLPFLVNADLILSQDRTGVAKNTWNKFILKKIGQCQFEWIAGLILNPEILPSVLNVLGSSEIQNLDKKFKKAYKKGFSKGLEETAFIPSMTPGRTLKLSQCCIDETGFWKEFFGRIADPSLQLGGVDGCSQLVSHELREVTKLSELEPKINKYDGRRLIENINSYFQNNPLLVIELLLFIKTYTEKNEGLLLALRKEKIRIMLTENNEFVSVLDCYFLEEEDKETRKMAREFKLNILAPSITENQQLTKWLVQILGIRTVTRLNVIRGCIFSLINKPSEGHSIDRENSVRLLKFVYDTHQQTPLEDDDFSVLKNFPVTQRNKKFVPISQCYLIDNCSEQLKALSISREYKRRIISNDENPRDDELWKQFLLKMGVQTDFELTVKDEIACCSLGTLSEDENEREALERYYAFIWKNNRQHLSAQQETPRPTTRFIHFVYFDFIHLIGDETYNQIFWSSVKEQWSDLMSSCSIKVAKGAPFPVMHYLEYILRYDKRVRGTVEDKKGNNLYHSTSLYSPLLRSDFSDLPLNFANIPVELTPAQLKFFGFRMNVSFEDCLSLLGNANCSKSPEKLRKIYLILLSSNDIDQQKLDKWKEKGKLLATDNQLYPIKELVINDGYGDTPPGSSWLHPCELLSEQRVALAKLFGLKRLSQMAEEFDYEDSGKAFAEGEEKTLMRLIRTSLPALAFLQSRALGKKTAQEILNDFATTLIDLNLSYHRKIRAKGLNKKLYAAFSKNFKVFHFSDRWLKNLTGLEQVVEVLGDQVFGFEPSIKNKCRDYFHDEAKKEDLLKAFEKQYGEDGKVALNDLFILFDQLILAADFSNLNIKETPLEKPVIVDRSPSPSQDDQSPRSEPSSPDPIDYEGLSVEVAQLVPKTSKERKYKGPFNTDPGKKTETKSHEQENVKIGRRGEEIVYKKLIEHYKKKYPSGRVIENDHGFLVETNKGVIKVRWYNKGLDSTKDAGEDHDIEITKEVPYALVLKSESFDPSLVQLKKDTIYLQKEGEGFSANWIQAKGIRKKLLTEEFDEALINQLKSKKFPAGNTGIRLPYDDKSKLHKQVISACDCNKRFIEVKSTRKASQLCNFSRAEWAKMHEARFRYRIYRVYQVKDPSNTTIKIFKDPVIQLEEEKIKVQEVVLDVMASS